MKNSVITALMANGYITTGANIAPRRPKVSVMSIEEANECTDNYSKKLCTNENPYYYIESDDINDETGYSIPGLDKYDKVTGKPIVTQLEALNYDWLMRKACKLD